MSCPSQPTILCPTHLSKQYFPSPPLHPPPLSLSHSPKEKENNQTKHQNFSSLFCSTDKQLYILFRAITNNNNAFIHSHHDTGFFSFMYVHTTKNTCFCFLSISKYLMTFALVFVFVFAFVFAFDVVRQR